MIISSVGLRRLLRLSGPTTTQRQILNDQAKYTPALGTIHAGKLEYERVLRLLPGPPTPADAKHYNIVLISKLVSGLPASIRSFIETVRESSNDPDHCVEFNDIVLVAQRQLSALPRRLQ
jgi:hypothetical protein